MIRIAYLSKFDFRTAKAHGYTIARTCEALNAREDVELTLVSTNGTLASEEARAAFFARHAVREPFPIVSLGSWGADTQNRSPLYFRLAALVAQFSLARWAWRNRRDIDMLFARDHLLPFPLLFAKYALRKPYIFECHFVLTKRFGQKLTAYLVRRALGAICITEGLARYYRRYNQNVIAVPCAASEPERYDISPEYVAGIRASLDIPEGAIILGYTGNMHSTGNGDPYGIEDIIRALPCMPEKVVFVGVGKKPGETLPSEMLAREMGIAGRTQFLAWVPRNDIAAYVLAFDILAVPASGARIGNSPTKAFEYLAARKPIVAADTEPIREVFRDNENALLVDYRDPASWCAAVSRLTSDPALASRLADGARADSPSYTWPARGAKIAAFITEHYHG